MSPQRKAVLQIKQTGTTDGINPRTLAALLRKKHLDAEGRLTKRGESFAAGRLGGTIGSREDLHFGKRKESKARGPKRRRMTKAREAQGMALQHAEFQKAERMTSEALRRILGPSGKAHAVKISPADGSTIKQKDVDTFTRHGWQVVGASTAPAKVGKMLPGVRHDEPFWNPDPLGEKGEARAVVIIGNVNAETVDGLRASGWDVSPAPKKLREKVKNPSPGERLYGEHASAAQRKAAAASHKKALAWHRDPKLVDSPQMFEWEPPSSFVDIGTIAAIEYESTKFDGKSRLYRHECSKKRRLLLSTCGSVLLVFPPFRVTTRGIEG